MKILIIQMSCWCLRTSAPFVGPDGDCPAVVAFVSCGEGCHILHELDTVKMSYQEDHVIEFRATFFARRKPRGRRWLDRSRFNCFRSNSVLIVAPTIVGACLWFFDGVFGYVRPRAVGLTICHSARGCQTVTHCVCGALAPTPPIFNILSCTTCVNGAPRLQCI